MEKKPTKKAKAAAEYDSQRETRVLLEDINKSVKTVAEQHDSIVKKLEEHDKRFDILEVAVTENSREIKAVKTDVKGLKTDTEQLKSGQEEIKQKLDTVTTDHEKRLQKLETAS